MVQLQPHGFQADLECNTVGMEVTPAILPSTAFCPTLSGDPGGLNQDHPVAPAVPETIHNACMQNEQQEVVQSIALQS